MRLLAFMAVLLVAPLAFAQSENPDKSDAPPQLPSIFVNAGAGYAGPPLPRALASSSQGITVGQVVLGDVHFFPFPFRELGFVVHGDATVLSTTTFLGSSAPNVFSVTAGPEAQTRSDFIIVRGALLGGVRSWSNGITTYVDPRVAFQMQMDFLIGRDRSSRPVVGFFGGIDVVPGVGWSAGTTLSFAIF